MGIIHLTLHTIRNMSKLLCLFLTFAIALCLFAANSSAGRMPRRIPAQQRLVKGFRYFPLHYSRDAAGNWKKPPASDYMPKGTATNFMEEEGGDYYYPDEYETYGDDDGYSY